ncbi:hypothetical protein E5198_08585 [Pseudomonas sp. A-1]|uniref:hypothetical protein n=1 Tax=Pseudomonas sp. A-1 TaxID=1821274 RepID=UPI0010A5DE09|nr:hypothetical protein [Pseudomonas sp. A-1]THG82988.1 hypothetical protein E5198_08585 [Pseudomonas sp. A-1]
MNKDKTINKNKSTDKQSKILNNSNKNTRHDIWLWLFIWTYQENELDQSSCNGITMREAIANHLDKNPKLTRKINQEKDKLLIDEKLLEWIEDDERQYQWLLPIIQEAATPVEFTITSVVKSLSTPNNFPHLTGRNRLIAMIDFWDISLAEKSQKIDNFRNIWLAHKSKDSELAWFDDKKDGAERCKCAWEWLQKNHYKPLSREQPISNYKELLIFFDLEDFNPTERKLIIQNIKNRWSRKQFNERSRDKRQVNVMLTNGAIELLDKLAKNSETKRAQVLEKLIRKEFENNLYLAD